jgi:hypothetical protein
MGKKCEALSEKKPKAKRAEGIASKGRRVEYLPS